MNKNIAIYAILLLFITASIAFIFGFVLGVQKSQSDIASRNYILVPYTYFCTLNGINFQVTKLYNDTITNITMTSLKDISELKEGIK